MLQHSIAHATVVVERRFAAAPERVFAAWSDHAKRVQWDTPGEGSKLLEHAQDFRVGGREKTVFQTANGAVLTSAGEYLDIVANTRIVSAGTMHAGDVRCSLTLCTVALTADGTGTNIVLTDQSAFLDGRESPEDRRQGWGGLMDKLEGFLSRKDA